MASLLREELDRAEIQNAILRAQLALVAEALVQIQDYYSQVPPREAVEVLRGMARAALAPDLVALAAEAERGREAERLLKALVDWQGIDHRTNCRAVNTENDEDCKCERRELADDVNEFFRSATTGGKNAG